MGQALYNIQLKSKWPGYLRCMEQGLSIKKTAKELKISIQTSFNWRHKILGTLDALVPTKLSDEVECDEMELALSHKGTKQLDRKPRKRGSDFKRNPGNEEVTVVQVITAVERNGDHYFKAVESKRLSEEDIRQALGGKLAKGTTLITDKHSSYKAFAKSHPEIKHKALLARDHVDKKDRSIHLQKVNNRHSQLRTFLRPFNGVSSKYLQNYLNWFAYSDQIRSHKETIKQWLVSILLTDQAYSLFQLFKDYPAIVRT